MLVNIFCSYALGQIRQQEKIYRRNNSSVFLSSFLIGSVFRTSLITIVTFLFPHFKEHFCMLFSCHSTFLLASPVVNLALLLHRSPCSYISAGRVRMKCMKNRTELSEFSSCFSIRTQNLLYPNLTNKK